MINTDQKIVAIVGRPNVGKSTLFNRLVGKRIAIETPVAGTTRDQLFGEVSWGGQIFTLVDLAGIEAGAKSEIDKAIQANILEAIDNADLIIFAVDYESKENEIDKKIARQLKKSGKKILLAVNKCDNIDRLRDLAEFERYGLPVIGVSAISGKNTGDLLDLVLKNIPAGASEKIKSDAIDLAIVGRPNVGKSTLINNIIGRQRAIVSDIPGTTRDLVDVIFSYKDHTLRLFDTAGLRRPGRVERGSIEDFSVIRTYRAVKDAKIIIVVIDAIEGLVALDSNILGLAKEWGKSVVLAVNKIDLWPDNIEEKMALMLGNLQTKLNFMPWLPVVFISAEEKKNIGHLLDQAILAYQNRATKIDQESLNQILTEAKNSNSQLFGLKSLVQKKNNPPIFELSYGGKKAPHESQIRYLENRIRDNFPMEGTPIFIDLKQKQNKNSR